MNEASHDLFWLLFWGSLNVTLAFICSLSKYVVWASNFFCVIEFFEMTLRIQKVEKSRANVMQNHFWTKIIYLFYIYCVFSIVLTLYDHQWESLKHKKIDFHKFYSRATVFNFNIHQFSKREINRIVEILRVIELFSVN